MLMKRRFSSTAARLGRLASLALLLLTLPHGSSRASGSPEWVNFFSANTTFFGQPVPVGAVIAAFDPQGVQCGEFTVTTEGKYGLMPCYRDDKTPPDLVDEGAEPGDVISFTINGLPAVASGPDDPIWTSNGDWQEVNLWMPESLTVSNLGAGTGIVTSSPSGIHCGADCAGNYDYDTLVTLTAYPGVQSYFVGWSGDCSGSEHTTTVTMDSGKSCTATFGWLVGGIVVTVGKLGLLAPWVELVAVAFLVVALAVVWVRRRRD